ncbi:MAG: glycosyltransferase family 2 protein [Anaerolineales bacterium]|nr:glycosyltransferase family 2 protein [Anaerolineales bacterium]
MSVKPGSVTAVILTLNEASHIQACIESLAWADAVVVFDSYSQDDTLTIARQAGAITHQHRFENYAQQRNAALDAVAGSCDWLFFVDADERATPELAAEIRSVVVEQPMAERPEMGWYVPRHNYIFGKLTLGAGWFPDYQLRLFKHGRVRYERPVHEVAVVDGSIGYLHNPLTHYNYHDKAQFHRTQRAYATYEATILHAAEMRPKPQNYVLQPLRQFWWRFVTLNGFSDGWNGFWLSSMMAYYEWDKYRKLAWMWRKR